MNKMKELLNNKKKIFIIVIVLALVILAAVLFSVYRYYTDPTKIVRGVDVSAYQGDIDWKELSNQGIYFAYIKATEGNDHVDERFEENWKNASKSKLKIGAYHFVSFTENGKTQAENFIKTVPKEKDSLPPVIDLELYGDYVDKPADKKKVQAIVNDMIIRLEEYYGKTPVIYTNYNTYNTYLSDSFAKIPIWICDISTQNPELEGGHEWLFWQYSQRGMSAGYEGEEKFIDMDVYNGTLGQFRREFR